MTGATDPEFAKICVVGLGYVGLPTAAVLASRGIDVLGVDIDEHIVATINRGEVPIVEPDLDALVRDGVAAGRLRATTSVETADAYIIAVPTPFGEHRKPDLSHLEAAARAVAKVLEKGNLVLLESTSPVGTTAALSAWLAAERADLTFPHIAGDSADIRIAYSPERVLPGQVLVELVANDRVIGGLSARCGRYAAQLYGLFVKGECFVTGAGRAELVKLAENAYRDVNIAFANELSLVCDKLAIDVWDVIDLANRHPRVEILRPGPGVGGHCIAVDPWFIVDSAPDQTPLIQAARAVNDGKPLAIAERVRQAAGQMARPAIACLGLAYKAGIDDLRQSPAIDIVRAVAGAGALLVVEPHIGELPPELCALEDISLVDLDAALDDAGIVLLLTDHDEFREIDRDRLAAKTVFDTRGLWR